ncbi:GIY-YIG endonuclease [Stenotrophomonas phage Marzo]|nr:GIY-YIG endonuclease [Stenotrophomonas phage Marzo]
MKAAIKKHGIENFRTEILEHFDCAEEMYKREAEVVNDEFLARPDVYNLSVGGKGGFDYLNRTGLNTKRDMTNNRNGGLAVIEKYGKIVGKKPDRSHVPPTFLGRKHTEETKAKMRLTDRAGSKNSQFGSIWITDGIMNKKHRGEIPEGWKRGRV